MPWFGERHRSLSLKENSDMSDRSMKLSNGLWMRGNPFVPPPCLLASLSPCSLSHSSLASPELLPNNFIIPSQLANCCLLCVSPKVLAKCVGHTMKITVLRVTQQRIYSASTDATVRIWDWAGTCIATLEGHNGPVHCMELRTMQDRQGSDRLWLISACGGGALRAWHPETGKAAWARTIHKAPIHCMVCDDDLIFTGVPSSSSMGHQCAPSLVCQVTV